MEKEKAVFTPLSILLEYRLDDDPGRNEYLVTGINMVISFITEFLYRRYYVFKDSIDTAVKPRQGETQ